MPPEIEFRLCFHDTRLIEDSPEQVTVEGRFARFTIANLTPGLLDALRLLIGRDAMGQTIHPIGVSETTLLELVSEGHFSEALRLKAYLRRFEEAGMLARTLWLYGPKATALPVRPLTQQLAPMDAEAERRQRYVLSRFACIRRERRRMIIESPLAHARIMTDSWEIMQLLGNVGNITDHPFPFDFQARKALTRLLYDAGLLTSIRDDGRTEEDTDEGLKQWSFHDLRFLTTSQNPVEVASDNQPAPVVKPPMSANIVELFKPNIEQLKQHDKPFTWVLEERRSLREYGEQPITRDQLGEFLYRSARIKEMLEGEPYDASRRPYPSAGALYEQELYIAVQECVDLAEGLYHYSPLHQLEKLDVPQAMVETLMSSTPLLTGKADFTPQTLIIVTARFQRLQWKYGESALILALKDAGVLYQTMYLVATAMELAPCALGAIPDANSVMSTAGIYRYIEPVIGCFLLGSIA
ncbi:MAG: SagB family peptide dehydrogenase [Burkholderiales bacterium]|nr:SagB family peptide dehydrogenase [Anaerolineae bacterium]